MNTIVPKISKVGAIRAVRRRRKATCPLMLDGVRAGFPSPAADYIERRIDLNEELITNPTATFFMRVKGDSMEGAGIRDGATLVVDRSLEARDGDTVVAVVEGDLTVKRLRRERDGCWLEAANPAYRPIKLGAEDNVWGVVTAVINQLRTRR
jgi:DNA polymerase V